MDGASLVGNYGHILGRMRPDTQTQYEVGILGYQQGGLSII